MWHGNWTYSFCWFCWAYTKLGPKVKCQNLCQNFCSKCNPLYCLDINLLDVVYLIFLQSLLDGEAIPAPNQSLCQNCYFNTSHANVNFANGQFHIGGRKVGLPAILFTGVIMSLNWNATTHTVASRLRFIGGYFIVGNSILENKFCPPMNFPKKLPM